MINYFIGPVGPKFSPAVLKDLMERFFEWCTTLWTFGYFKFKNSKLCRQG